MAKLMEDRQDPETWAWGMWKGKARMASDSHLAHSFSLKCSIPCLSSSDGSQPAQLLADSGVLKDLRKKVAAVREAKRRRKKAKEGNELVKQKLK